LKAFVEAEYAKESNHESAVRRENSKKGDRRP
jgi:hypothetical protein